MKSPDEVLPQLAAMIYYRDADRDKELSFEQLDEEDQKPYRAKAAEVLVDLDKLNLCVTTKSTKNAAEVEKLLHDKIEGAVDEFFDKVKVWKKNLIPKQELVAMIWQVWKGL